MDRDMHELLPSSNLNGTGNQGETAMKCVDETLMGELNSETEFLRHTNPKVLYWKTVGRDQMPSLDEVRDYFMADFQFTAQQIDEACSLVL